MSGHRRAYLGGSRDVDLTKIGGWGEAPSPESTLWVYGPAGLGKTVLALELSERLRGEDRLGAFLSLSSLPNHARGPESVVKMIAREIGEIHPETIPLITNAITACKSTSLRDHICTFIGEPIRALQRTSHPLLVVLDAFDEWEFSGLLAKELDCLTPFSSSLKFILFGRSDPRTIGCRKSFIRPHELQPVSKAVMIEYVTQQFGEVEWDYERKPSVKNASSLAEQADGLFIWASIACSLLKKGLGLSSPNATLEAIIHSQRKIGETGPMRALYTDALLWLFPDEEERALLRRYLAAVLVLKAPLALDDFASLVGLPVRSVKVIQSRLKALQVRAPSSDNATVYSAVSLFHLSFVECLHQTSAPSSPTPFATPIDRAHLDMAKACSRELTALFSTRPKPIPERAMYAVKWWFFHLSDGAPPVEAGSFSEDLISEWEKESLWFFMKNIPFDTLCALAGQYLDAADLEAFNRSMGQVDSSVPVLGEGLDLCTITFNMALSRVGTLLFPKSAQHWTSLGQAYLRMSEATSSDDYAHRAVAAQKNALQVGENLKGADQAGLFQALGAALFHRFTRLGEVSDLHESISHHRTALACEWDPTALASLAQSLLARSCIKGSLEDLRLATDLSRSLLASAPPGSSFRTEALDDLSRTLNLSFKATNSLEDLEEDIRLKREALELIRPGNPLRIKYLHALAGSLTDRASTTSSFDDLEEVIGLLREALTSCPAVHPLRSRILGALGTALWARFQDSVDSLHEAIEFQKEALALLPPDHHDRPSTLCHLAHALQSRFAATNSFEDLQEAISVFKEELATRDPIVNANSDNLSFHELSRLLGFRASITNTIEDLDEAIDANRRGLTLHPPGNPDRFVSLAHLASSLHLRFRKANSSYDLQEAIDLSKEALGLRPTGDPDRLRVQGGLVEALQSRIEATKSIDDLEDAIPSYRELLAFTPPGDAKHLKHLKYLAIALVNHLQAGKGTEDDCQEAIAMLKEAMALVPPGQLDHLNFLGSLAVVFLCRFELTGSIGDLQEAIAQDREAIMLTGPGIPPWPSHLLHLGICLEHRFRATNCLDDLEEAISLHGEALTQIPFGHPDRSVFLYHRSSALRERLLRTTDTLENRSFDDILESLGLTDGVLIMVSQDEPAQIPSFDNVADPLESDSQGTDSDVEDQQDAVALGKEADIPPELAGPNTDKPQSKPPVSTPFPFRFHELLLGSACFLCLVCLYYHRAWFPPISTFLLPYFT